LIRRRTKICASSTRKGKPSSIKCSPRPGIRRRTKSNEASRHVRGDHNKPFQNKNSSSRLAGEDSTLNTQFRAVVKDSIFRICSNIGKR
jgi:hypothetical protein